MYAVEVTGRDVPLVDPSRILLLGNGGSMAVCQHIACDLNKRMIPALVPDMAQMTMWANDEAWNRAYYHWVNATMDDDDVLIIVSSSGRSMNLYYAAEQARDKGDVITLTGFDADNPIRTMGTLNYYVPSHNYGVVETTHLAILHSIVNPGT